MSTFNSQVALTGDIKICLDRDDDCHHDRFTDILNGFRLTQFISDQHQLEDALDVIVIDSAHSHDNITVVDVGVSDHMPVLWTVDISPPTPRYVTVSKYAWKSFGINAFQNAFQVQILNLSCYGCKHYHRH